MTAVRTLTSDYTLSPRETPIAVNASSQKVTLTVPAPMDATGGTILLQIQDATYGVMLTSPASTPPHPVLQAGWAPGTPDAQTNNTINVLETSVWAAYPGAPTPQNVTLVSDGAQWFLSDQ